MAKLVVDFYSEVLEFGTAMTVLLPQAVESQIGIEAGTRAGDPPVLYLLHGLSDDHTAWTRYSAVERYAEERGVAVVMPQVHRSFYADEAHGHRYWTFLTEELPRVVDGFFRVSRRREDTFVAGLSMGGYGALKWALREPHRFAAAASLSGVLDLRGALEHADRDEIAARVFDDDLGPGDDLVTLVESADPAALPALYVGCGTEDHLLAGNHRFLEAAAAVGVAAHVDLRPGDHEWSLWDAVVRDVLAWLPVAG